VVDLGPFLAGDHTVRRHVAREIGDACRGIGFFYIVGHGVPESVVATAMGEARRFFDLSSERKRRIAIENSPCHRGYFSVGGENLDPARQRDAGDLKEGVKLGRDLCATHPLVRAGTPLHGPNQWPDDLPGWREVWEDYYRRLCALGHTLMEAFALSLGLDEDFFESRLTGPMATAGPLHYPPQEKSHREQCIGAGAHSDFGCLTILAQDDVPGLQVRNRAGGWLEAPCRTRSFIVNVGDMMERWTNDEFASTVHRVINRSGRDRYSIPFFFDPDFDADVSCLATCQGPANPPRYVPATGGQYLLNRIRETFDYRR